MQLMELPSVPGFCVCSQRDNKDLRLSCSVRNLLPHHRKACGALKCCGVEEGVCVDARLWRNFLCVIMAAISG